MSKTELIVNGGIVFILGGLIYQLYHTRKEIRQVGKEINYLEENQEIMPKKRFKV